ncbi:MAG: DUF547 domain-containing protein [Phycisphaerales bacterium]|nr:DUF547 domain-containing protein [Phycisphaerales bacterium]
MSMTYRMVVLAVGVVSAGVAWGKDIEPPRKVDRFQDEWDKVNFSHALLTDALHEFVDQDGLLDYDGLRKNRKFNEYLYRLANTDAAGLPSSEAKMAFWINAYNALTIKGAIETRGFDHRFWSDYSVKRVFPMDVDEADRTFFRGLKFVVGGERYTLDEIEKGVLLGDAAAAGERLSLFQAAGPTGRDSRIHLALVRGALGCPPLSRDAYEADKLDAQLTERAKAFVLDKLRCRIDAAKKLVEISQVFEWYAADFSNPQVAPNVKSVFEFLAKYVDDPVLRKSLTEEQWQMTYIPFDWMTNDKGHLKTQTPGEGGAEQPPRP